MHKAAGVRLCQSVSAAGVGLCLSLLQLSISLTLYRASPPAVLAVRGYKGNGLGRLDVSGTFHIKGGH